MATPEEQEWRVSDQHERAGVDVSYYFFLREGEDERPKRFNGLFEGDHCERLLWEGTE